jgi:hypothetical protein
MGDEDMVNPLFAQLPAHQARAQMVGPERSEVTPS